MWVSFLFHPWWRQFAWILLQWTHFHEFSVVEIQFGCFQIDSIRFHGFRSTRNNIHGYWINQTDFSGKHIHKLFTFFHELAINGFCFQGRPISGKAFVTIVERIWLWILIDGVDFHSFLTDGITFNGVSNSQLHFRGFPVNEINFNGVPSRKSLSLVFQSTLLVFMEIPLRIGCLHGFSVAWSWLRWSFFLQISFPRVYFLEIGLLSIPITELEIVVLPFRWNQFQRIFRPWIQFS